MHKDTHQMLHRLFLAGIEDADALALRRISMALHRWHELECGTDHGCIERDESTGKPYWTCDIGHGGKRGRQPISDREKGALERLAAIMARYPGFEAYVQGDPRGCALYILTPGQMASREPGWLEANYSRGIAVHR